MNSSGLISSNSANKLSSNDDLRREFEQNYRRYLDTVYLFNRINETLLSSQLSLTNKDTRVDVQKLRQQFLKAINTATTSAVSNSSSNITGIGAIDVGSVKNRLTDEAKNYLREKIGQHVDKELGDINMLLNCDESDERETNDLDEVTLKLRELTSTIEEAEKRCQAAKSDYNIKLEHCVKLAAEIVIILRRMLDEFKLSFYDNKNRASCEQLLLEIELFFAKTELTVYELVDSLYGKSDKSEKIDKQHTLSVIRSHLDTVTERTKDSLSRAQSQLDAYKSLGRDFQLIVEQYTGVKRDLEFKRNHLKRIKSDMCF